MSIHKDSERVDQWGQLYKIHDIAPEDVLLPEYELQAKVTEQEQKLFLSTFAGVFIALSAFGTLLVNFLDKFKETNSFLVPAPIMATGLCLLLAIATVVAVGYLAEKGRHLALAKRKMAILRFNLGIEYGPLKHLLTASDDSINDPLKIRLFKGWISNSSYIFWLIAPASTAILAYALYFIGSSVRTNNFGLQFPAIVEIDLKCLIAFAAIAWISLLAAIFRSGHFNQHENFLLLFCLLISKFIRLKLVSNFELVFYYSRLGVSEILRQQVQLSNIVKSAVYVEDKTFYSHYGFSLKGIFRALLGLLGLARRSGGSTITQQLARTLFIEDYNKKIRRKVIEILLAIWIEQILTKEEILNYYLASVRFEKQVFGILSAMHYFFGAIIKAPTNAESFFLIERVSNVRSGILIEKIRETISLMYADGRLVNDDISAIAEIYKRMIDKGLVVCPQSMSAEDVARSIAKLVKKQKRRIP